MSIVFVMTLLMMESAYAHLSLVDAMPNNLGVLIKHGQEMCFRSTVEKINPGSKVEILELSDIDGNEAKSVGNVIKADMSCADLDTDAVNRFGYVIQSTDKNLSYNFIGVGLLRRGISSHAENSPDARYPSDTLTFRVCNSLDGVHLTAWAGKPLFSDRVWHAYVYLDQDLVPDCSKRETQ